jgi:hypothetical protein
VPIAAAAWTANSHQTTASLPVSGGEAASKNLDSCPKPFMSSGGKGKSMVRQEHAIAECNDRAPVAGMDFLVPVSSKTKAKTTTKTV